MGRERAEMKEKKKRDPERHCCVCSLANKRVEAGWLAEKVQSRMPKSMREAREKNRGEGGERKTTCRKSG